MSKILKKQTTWSRQNGKMCVCTCSFVQQRLLQTSIC